MIITRFQNEVEPIRYFYYTHIINLLGNRLSRKPRPMKRCSGILFVLLSFFTLRAQDKSTTSDVNTLFELKLDSIEVRITEHKWGIDTNQFLHFTVKNRSEDSLTYVTNSCFYYNHYALKTPTTAIDINPSGGCSFNQLTPFVLAPGTSVSRSEWAVAAELAALAVGELDVTLTIPLISHEKNNYRVDGRDFVENKKQLIYSGKTKVVRTYSDNRKRKKSRS